ncbi:MAG: hypothetical protein KBB01_00435 [Candidatus Omnitrophica bacterium]|jgi:type IV pilus assembly protein PilQ|nr:hypothetical protein [Candidatus Omnitrophota bacterium]
MKNQRVILSILSLVCFYFILSPAGFGEELKVEEPKAEELKVSEKIPVIRFKDADIRVVLQSIAQKATKDGEKVNIIVAPNIEGLVSVNLEDVDWLTALEAVLRSYNYSYEWVGKNIILVDVVEKIQERQAQEKQRQEIEPVRTKVFGLKYIDANDAKAAVEPLLSPLGRVSVLEVTGQAGWEFGSDVTKRSRTKEAKVSRTKTLIVSDVSKKLEEVEALLLKIDIMPKQVLIKARIMEVARDALEDVGLSWGTGATGATASTAQYVSSNKKNGTDIAQMALRAITPQTSVFDPKATGLDATDFQFAYKKLTGTTFQVILSALEEDARTNTLSAPNILTLNNQEASILVGEKFPIVKTEVSTETSQITGGSLDYYQDIGIQLNVVPQISGENEDFINMIIHPAVTSSSTTVKIVDQDGTTLVEYPKITSREIETQIMVKTGETIAIGGLYKDVISKAEIGIPILKDIPLLGWLFKRHTEDTGKIDLVIFITAEVIKPGEVVPVEVTEASAAVISPASKEKSAK